MTTLNLFSVETFTIFLVKKLIPCPVCQPVQPYIQPNFVVSAKIRLIRISAEKFVQPAEFKKKQMRGLTTTTTCYGLGVGYKRNRWSAEKAEDF